MKRSLMVSGGLLILGAILLGWGWQHRGDKPVVWNHQDRRFEVIQQKKQRQRLASYRHIVIDTTAPVTIRQGDTRQVTLHNFSSANNRLRARVSQGTLTVTGGSTTMNYVLGFGSDGGGINFSSNGDKRGVVITVPKTQRLDSIVSKREGGELSLKKMTVKQISIKSTDDVSFNDIRVTKTLAVDTTDGDISGKQVKADRVDLTAEEGDVSLTQSHFKAVNNRVISRDGDVRLATTQLGGGHVVASDGDIQLHDNRLMGTLKATATDGDISARIAPAAGAKVTTTDSDDDIHVVGHSRSSGYWLRRAASAQYRLSTDDGDITVTQ
ncbi:DUF4097 domain-containing protein [Levilactobacillus brevis]|uniref:DUF4097 domain-containing protein n=1 Tax=Levilactobacillus brevis TaxID=1580 RepID=UPI000A20579E|nr:DUF4097 domain-containing protein [Levilactobacillus brevis]ARN98540.1 hypothetical protein AZI10_11260 [Levilactobacillus brevis]